MAAGHVSGTPHRWILLGLALAAVAGTPSGLVGLQGQQGRATPPVHAPVVTIHEGAFNGRRVRYEATVSEIVVPDAAGRPAARIVSTAYTEVGADPATRPVMFLWNGGPISPSVWVHLGAFGPKRVIFPDDIEADPSTFQLGDNPYSILDVTDLVFFDPAGTGFSRVLEGIDPGEFYTTEADAQQTTAFIAEWLRSNNRLASPTYILGESYGTIRAPEVARMLLHLPDPIVLDGIVLMSSAVNMLETSQRPWNIISQTVSLPTLAALAYYHGKIDRRGRTLEEVIDEAFEFARGEYLEALYLGQDVPAGQRDRVAARLAGLTGVPASYWTAHDLRITKVLFRSELLKDEGLVMGYYDGRYTAPAPGPGRPAPDASSMVSDAIVEARGAYMRDFLDVDWCDEYRLRPPLGIDEASRAWRYAETASPFADFPYTRSVTELLTRNPKARLLITGGVYDLTTTIGAAAYSVAQSDWPEGRVRLDWYPGGHMTYSIQSSLIRLADDVRTLIAESR